MSSFFKREVKKYATLNHQQWGWFGGMLYGITLATYVISTYGLKQINMQIEGPIEDHNKFFNLIVQIGFIPFTGGVFGGMFSHLGSGIDIITNKETLLSWAYRKCTGESEEPESLIQHQKAEEKNYSSNKMAFGSHYDV